MVQANLSPLKHPQANQPNDNEKDGESVSVNANTTTAQCAVEDPGRSLCSFRCTTRTKSILFSGKSGIATNSLANLANLAKDNVNAKATATATEREKVSVSDKDISARCAEGAPVGACAADAAPHTSPSHSLSTTRSDDQAAAFCALSAR